MRETYIVAAGVNGTEIMKSLAYHGKACFNHRFVSPVELARLALIKSGIIVSETILSPKEQVAQISLLLSGNQYFGEATYADLHQITTAINRIRHLAVDAKDDVLQSTLGKGMFREKNEELYRVCSQYLQSISREKCIDSTALIQKAIQEASALDAEIICLQEFPLSPLERKLCSVLSQGTYSEKEIRDLYNRPQCPIKIAGIKNCYGAANEIESIISEIYSGKNLDACTIAITDTAVYSQLLFDYALQYQIPMTFGCGIPIANSNPAKLLRLYLRWMAESFFSGEMLKKMLTSDVFDRSRLLSGCSDLTAEFPWKTFYEVLSASYQRASALQTDFPLGALPPFSKDRLNTGLPSASVVRCSVAL